MRKMRVLGLALAIAIGVSGVVLAQVEFGGLKDAVIVKVAVRAALRLYDYTSEEQPSFMDFNRAVRSSFYDDQMPRKEGTGDAWLVRDLFVKGYIDTLGRANRQHLSTLVRLGVEELDLTWKAKRLDDAAIQQNKTALVDKAVQFADLMELYIKMRAQVLPLAQELSRVREQYGKKAGESADNYYLRESEINARVKLLRRQIQQVDSRFRVSETYPTEEYFLLWCERRITRDGAPIVGGEDNLKAIAWLLREGASELKKGIPPAAAKPKS